MELVYQQVHIVKYLILFDKLSGYLLEKTLSFYYKSFYVDVLPIIHSLNDPVPEIEPYLCIQ